MSAPASPVPPTPASIPAPDDSLSSALKSTADRPPACLASGSGLDGKAIPSVTDPNDKVATVIVDGKPVSVAPADMAMKPDELAGQDESQDVGKPDVVQEEAAQPEQELQADRDQKEAQGEPGTKPTSEEEEEKEEEEDEDEEGEEGEEAPRESNLAANTAVKTDLEPDMKGESIEDDPNLAVVISFLTKFGAQCGLEGFNLEELETHLESREEVLPKWMQLHIKLLRKINKSVTPAKWERSLVKFVYLVSTDDGWDLEKFGYRLVPSTMKLRILKSLLESQFDFNVKFKSEVNKQDAQNLRCHPLGWDKLGNAYWYNMDDEANLRVYKEDPDEETWELAARSKDEFLELIGQLKTGATYLKRELTTIKSEEPALEDDDDDPQELANIIRDTGPVPESCQTSYGNSDDDDDSRPLQIDEGPAKESDPEESKGESDSAKSVQTPKTLVTPSSVSISPPSVDPAPSSDAIPPLSVALAPSIAPVPPPSDAPAPTPVPSTVPAPTPAPVSAPAPSPPKKSHYSIESLISKDDRHMKRPLEVENGSPNAEKRPKLAPSETISEPTMLVVGQGNGVDNKDAPEPRPADDTHSEEDEVIEEPVMVFSGLGSGVDNLARNPDNDNDSNSNGVDHEEKKLGESELKSVKRGHPESTKEETMSKEDQIKSDPEDMEEDQPKPKRGKEDEELKSNGKDESACDTKEDKKMPKKKKHPSKKGQDPEDEDEPILRSSRRTSSRIATLRIREAERRQKEEENALDDFREKMRRKAEREQNRLDKYRAMGREFEREMAKTRKRGKAETSDEDYEDEGEGNKTATKRKRRKKKKKKRGEENLREFAKFSSGSSDDEGLEGEEDEDLEGEHEEDDHDEVLFHSDHEFSCESDVPDGEAQPIQHARTATKGKKRKKKKTRKTESVETVVAAESESEEDDSDDNWACKKCNKRDHPEWILLCDKCDDGWHASCLRPSLMVIPEGSWFCPNCQHAVLLTKLEENLVSFEVLLKKKDAETKRKERLAFVSMSLSNILPPKATSSGAKKPANKTKSENPRRHVPRKRHRSDDSFSGSSSGSSSDGNSTSSEEEEPVKDGRRRATRNVSYSLKAYDDMIRSAIADEVVYLPVAGQGKAIEAAAPDDDEEDGEGGEDEEEEENVEQAKSSTGQSGLGRGKDMANILGADDDEEEGASAKEKDDDDDDDKDEIVPSDVPQPIKMEIQKDIPSGKGKKKAKKSKKFGALSSSDDGDGDSGSDFVASEISLEEDEEDEEEFLDDAVSSDDGGLGTSSRKKSSRAATRKSNRNRKVMYDEDFVFDGSDSEDDPSKKKKKRRKNDDSWDSEISLEDDEEEYGSKKKKKSSSKKKSRLKYDSLSSEEDDEDFEASISKKKQRILSDTSAQRKTRGKKIQFEWEESDDDSDVPLRRSKAPSSSASKKKKGGKKRVDDTDTEMEDYQSEPELDDDEEEDSD
ncbi:remodeling and spacing factor 1-like [Tigriopus californicus]|uniref:remodeling and spacing factor 1-like n=1 Tax=Tigriopus californicus TaxID=6832 RepID=UPI0027DA4EBE|nr:remodeling and spacing factor 1-like [Tigriopus californicus]